MERKMVRIIGQLRIVGAQVGAIMVMSRLLDHLLLMIQEFAVSQWIHLSQLFKLYFNILKTVINGEVVFEDGESNIESIEEGVINKFNCQEKNPRDVEIHVEHIPSLIRVIEALEGQLITRTILMSPTIAHNKIVSDVEKDVLKVVVVNRYTEAPVAKAFITHFGLKRGAIASTVAHDSHNIIFTTESQQGNDILNYKSLISPTLKILLRSDIY